MPDANDISLVHFRDINLQDPFFDSLRASYQGFDDWFRRKDEETAYVMQDNNGIQAFLYLKIEEGAVTDITPPLNSARCLKVGTFKVNAHGTKLGERFVKKIFDHAIVNEISHIYVTVFAQHRPLINILERYGFYEYGTKTSASGEELAFVKNFNNMAGETLPDYPVVNCLENNTWLMSIYPQWHTKLFPDSILRTEKSNIIEDISHTNSIHKVYIGWMAGMEDIRPKDTILIYRSVGNAGRPWFESVITSFCTVTERTPIRNFPSLAEFQSYAGPHSVFTPDELRYFYTNKPHGQLVKMTYNIALPKRPNMKALVEDAGLDRKEYWGFKAVTPEQLVKIVEISRIPSSAIVM